MNKKWIGLSLLNVLAVQQLVAQTKSADTLLKATTIEITQIYKPQIKQAVKEPVNPTLPSTEAGLPSYTYDVPQPATNYAYKAQPLQPLAYKQDSALMLYNNYVKFGLGNLQTIYLDAGTQQQVAPGWLLQANAGFLRQEGALRFQQHAVATLRADLTHSSARWDKKISLDAGHREFYQYGFDQLALPNKVVSPQHLSGATLSYRQHQTQFGKSGYRFLADAAYGYHSATVQVSEHNALAVLGVEKRISSKWVADAAVEARLASTETAFTTYNNNIAALRLGIQYQERQLFLKANLKPAIGQNGNTFLLQDVLLRYGFQKSKTNLSIGTQGLLHQNTYRQSFLTNPFVSLYNAQQTHSNELYLFVEQAIGNHLGIWAKASNWRYEHLATFVNSPIADGEQMMSFYIPRIDAFSAQFGARYQVGATFSLGAQMALISYYNALNGVQPWHLPTSKLALDMQWRPMKSLHVTAYAQHLGGIKAMDAKGQPVNVSGFLDLGFGAEYGLRPKIALFLNTHNLLNSKYERWLGYQAYGINIYGGIRLKF